MCIPYVKIGRTLKEHQLWLEKPFSRGQAWVDLIMLANYKDGHIRRRGIKVAILRGEVGYSLREIADRWGWSLGKVQRYIDELKNDTQIDTRNDTKNLAVTSVIRLINYDRFQGDDTENDTKNDTETGTKTGTKTSRRRVQSKEEEEEEERKEKDIPPSQQIIDLYHDKLPCLPRVVKLGDSLKAKISARWKEPGQGDLDWWAGYFDLVAQSDFLTGRKTDFRASFDWLLGPINMSKVLNGAYANRPDAPRSQYGGRQQQPMTMMEIMMTGKGKD